MGGSKSSETRRISLYIYKGIISNIYRLWSYRFLIWQLCLNNEVSTEVRDVIIWWRHATVTRSKKCRRFYFPSEDKLQYSCIIWQFLLRDCRYGIKGTNRINHHTVEGTRESHPSVHDLQSTTRLFPSRGCCKSLGGLDLQQRRITGVRRVLEMSYIRYQRMRILSPGVPEIRHYTPVKKDRLQPVQYGGQ